MCVDEAGHEYPVYVVFDEGTPRLFKGVDHPIARSYVFDSPTGNRNSTVQDGWSGDRNDEPGGVDLDDVGVWAGALDLCVILGKRRSHGTIVHCLFHEVHQAQLEPPHYRLGEEDCEAQEKALPHGSIIQ